MFKEKSSKKRIPAPTNARESATLDARHQQILTKLSDKQNTLESLLDKKDSIEKEITAVQAFIEELKSKHPNAAALVDNPGYDQAWNTLLEKKEALKHVESSIRDIQDSRDEIQYYEKTADILYNYYKLLDSQGQTGSDGAHLQSPPLPPPRAASGKKKTLPIPKRSILEAFQPVAAASGCGSLCSSKNAECTKDGEEATAEPTMVDKSTLVDNYLVATDPSYIRRVDTEAIGSCDWCHVPLLCLQQDGIMICPECGYQELLLVEQNRPILRAPSAKEGSHQSYKRINHFREWCAQIQGKESTEIPEEIFEKILAEIKKEKITDLKKITNVKMREILKRIRATKYYEHGTYIINRINGVPTPHFSPELEERLCIMFKQVQAPFNKHCPANRVNFLSYSYVLSKLLQILGLHEYVAYFPLLKSREKLSAQDDVFKKICADLGWTFYPSI